jgi:hypothetical protein
MIVFDLRCANNHHFEGWFDNGADCEKQLAQAQICCPCCDETRVERVLSPVSIKKKTSPSEGEWKSTYQAWRRVCRYVRENFEDVGHSFAKEALKVHYGQAEERNIRGVTTEQEEDMLEEEGVSFVKIPMLQEMDN